MKRILGAHLEKGPIVAHPGMFSERRDDQAGFTGSQGEAQDPGGKATEGPILAQPPDVCSNSQGPEDGRAASCGNEVPATAGDHTQRGH